MGQAKITSRGFTLIAALIILVLLSGVAAGILFMVTNESRMGGNDLETNLAFYGAESGMEKLTADLSSLYTQSMSPTNAQIQNLINFPPTPAMVSGMSYAETINYPLDANGNPLSSWNTISSGANQGLDAEIVPMSLQVIATRPSGASVNMTRKVEVALIPVFQFGVFCGYDCSYFAGPNFGFGGRVHTNGNLFLAAGSDLVFNDKIAAFQQIVMDRLENGYLTTGGYGGTVYVPKATGGCALVFPPPGTNCVALPGAGTVPGDASWSGGYPSLAGTANTSFPSISSGSLNGFMINALTGATNMQLPFVQNSCTSNPPPCTDPIAIVRKPQPGESATSTLGSARLYNKAQIRVLLADTVADLHPERGVGALDADDVQFSPGSGYPIPSTAGVKNTSGASVSGQEYYGIAVTSPPTNNWVNPVGHAGWTSYPLLGELTTAGIPNNGQGAWIRVEYADNAGVWHGITRDWLSWSFTRQYNQAPTGPGADPYNPNAIIILQQMNPGATSPIGNQNAFYPINFYDTREGEMRDAANGCAVNGIMSAVEINVGNLAKWLAHQAPYTQAGDVGNLVNFTNQNGYILYFSDHRGMLPDPNPSNGGQTPAGVISGESGLEDVVNSAQPLPSTNPDGALEAATYYTYSPEDADQNGKLDNWGGANIGYGFGVNTNTAPPNPYLTTSCTTTGLSNAVSGARHVLKLVGGGMNAGVSYLPVRPDNGQGGFTVSSENPVYVQGNYNSGPSDPYWTGGSNATPHAAAAIIADTVTVLSNNWNDANSLANPTSVGGRVGTTTYYRMAVAAGKNVPFPQPVWGAAKDFGTDGGLHNFLRYLENWGGQQLFYNGSLVSMYYSEYDTGTFKCCTTVYSPPTRNFSFDTLFLNPANLPAGTPMFQDVVNLSYHQNFTPQ
ncbi:MAG TPA: PilX N-terminal domain-containing pilus assembly protein [Candidatus Sulfotelmatobacter sp.]|nr:PilX N-terminal domain-containing pilus assembly protein [Candidatus Sulfotelmatobacter sp.]